MKKIPPKFFTILFLFSCVSLFFPVTLNAAGCAYVCDNTDKPDEIVCSKLGETAGSPIPLKDEEYCSEKPACVGSTRPVCCCTTPTSIVTPVSETVPKSAPKFTMPEFQIPIDTVKLSSSTCTADASGNYQCSVPWIGEYIVGLYNYGISIAGILAAIILMAGGVLWLVSGGDASKVTQAKELIIGSVTGLIILTGSYVLLTQINPNLVKLKSISLGYIEKELNLAMGRIGSIADSYKNAPCATDEELKNGTAFYATGYYKPAFANTDKFFCVVGMQCSCPGEDPEYPEKTRDFSKNCDFLYGKTFPNYHPCKPFPAATDYCNINASGVAPKSGDIAGPGNCLGNLPRNTQICFKGKTYTITDTGGGIKGKRIDIWTGSSLDDAYANTGVGMLKKGPCK